MHLHYVEVSAWPSLVWVAQCPVGSRHVYIYHGSRLEIGDEWFSEAVWDGKFDSGDFDLTDIVAGSGGRVRDSELVLVSSGSTCDRLQALRVGDVQWISNSLVCLLTSVEAKIDPVYSQYYKDFGSVIFGLSRYKRTLAASVGSVELIYFHNVVWNGRELQVREKPKSEHDLSNYAKYRDFLCETMQRVAENLRNGNRSHKYSLLTTLSSGYDSTAVATIARTVDCHDALSFSHAYKGIPDDGAIAAKVLGYQLHLVGRDEWKRQPDFPEAVFVACDAKGEDRYFSGAADLLRDRVLLTGFHGDKVWDKTTKDLSDQIVRGDWSGLSLTEFRLRAGFIHCPVPFWGVRQIRDIYNISHSQEMTPWDVPGDYSRPICRRLAEEAGVPREAFGMQKKMASIQTFHTPEFLASESMADFLRWARRHRWQLVLKSGSPIIVSPGLNRLIYRFLYAVQRSASRTRALMKKLPVVWRLSDRVFILKLLNVRALLTPIYLGRHIFPWALEKAKRCYQVSSPFISKN